MKKAILFLLLLLTINLFSQETYNNYTPLQQANPSSINNSSKSCGWFLQFLYPTFNSVGEAGCETDGTYFYTVRWNLNIFYRYDIYGNYLNSFTVFPADHIRDLAYDGQYFYGSPATNTIYVMDFTPGSESLVDTINAPPGVTVRSIAWEPPPNEGLWVSDWSGNENWTKIDKTTGAFITDIPYSSHLVDANYGLAFDNFSPGGPYLWGFCQSFDPNLINWSHLVQVEVSTGLQTGVWHDVGNDPQINSTHQAGGAFIHPLPIFPGTVTLGGCIQDFAIFGYDVASTYPMDWDVAPVDLIAPQNANNLTIEDITVEIMNNGINVAVDIPLHYSVDGNPVVDEVWTGANLAPNTSGNYTFTVPADFSVPGSHEVKIYTTMVPDLCHDNDTLHATVINTFGQYCTAGANVCNDEYISRVQVGTLDNSSGNGCPFGYTNFNHLYASLTAGVPEFIVVTNGNPFAGDKVTVFIDNNLDGDFDDFEEDIPLTSNNGGLLFTGYICTNYLKSVVDTSVMRVRLAYNVDPQPCGNSSYGETEDYSVILIPGNSQMFSCAIGSTPEIETCGVALNNGCDSTVMFQDIVYSESVCGTVWIDPLARDTDWYRFTVTDPKVIKVTISVLFECLFGIMDLNNGCSGADWVNGNAYKTIYPYCGIAYDSVQVTLAPGIYAAYVAPTLAEYISCSDTARYNLKLLAYDPPPPCNVICPPGATQELESCHQHLNDGCNMTVPAYQDISYNETVCGNVYIDSLERDTDWYRFTVNSNASVTLSAQAEFQADIAIIDITKGCGNEAILVYDDIDSCEVRALNMVLGQGVYAAFIAPDYAMNHLLCTAKNEYTISVSNNGPPLSYCTTLYNFGCVNGRIDTFRLNTIINNSSGCTVGGYSDFTAMTTDLEACLVYDLKVSTNFDNQYISMWIDYNNNNYFDHNEIAVEDYWIEYGEIINTVPVIIPYTANTGLHRLRIRSNNGASSANPCAIYNYGEAEDYTVNITPPGPCVVTCPANALQEGEQCGQSTNNGCFGSGTPLFENISDSDVICGTIWYDGFFRDTDWFEFEVTYITPVKVKVKTEFDYEIAFYDINNGCSGILLDEINDLACNIRTMTYMFYPGNYAVMIGPDVNGGIIPCNSDNEYWLELDYIYDPPCTIAIPPNAIIESEACGDSLNNGCNLQAPVFSNIDNGDVIYGTCWGNVSNKDSDWYIFFINDVSDIYISGLSEFDCEVKLLNVPACNAIEVLSSNDFIDCETIDLRYQGLGQGSYVIYITPQSGDTMSCNNWYNHYKISLDVVSPSWCHSSALESYDSKIDSVAFNTIQNGSSGPNCKIYTDYTTKSTEVKIGFTYPLTVQTGTCGNDYEKGVKVYIDWNGDYDFNDSGEEVAAFGPDILPVLYNTNVTVPINASDGVTTRMRVICMETTDMNDIDPCGEYSFGETEDYTINLVPRILTYTGLTISDTINVCAGNVIIPLMVQDMNDVGGFSMKINIDAGLLSYSSVQNVNTELSKGNLIVTQVGSTINIIWNSNSTEANVGDGLLMELLCNGNPGYSDLNWDLSQPGYCEYHDISSHYLASQWINGYADLINCSTIDGVLYYLDDGDTSTAVCVMNNSTIYLESNGTFVDTAYTDVNGHYFFDVLQTGAYDLSTTTAIPYGGINASDALAVMLHFAHYNHLQGIPLIIADVDTSGFINTLDALYIAKRFVSLINYFPSGDWYFEVPQAVVTDTMPLIIDYTAACFGDVNGSYLIPQLKTNTGVNLEFSGTKLIETGEIFTLPVFVNEDIEIGAVSLVLEYPADKLEVLDVIPYSDNVTLLYNVSFGKIRIAAYDENTMSLNSGDALIKLELKAINSFEGISFKAGDESELADGNGHKIENAKLFIPEPVNSDITKSYYLGQNFPNPFDNVSRIEYSLPEQGNVSLETFNLLGEQVKVLVKSLQEEGFYNIEINVEEFSPGIYFYQIDVKGKTTHFVQTKRMIVTGR